MDTGVKLIKYIEDYNGLEKINTREGMTTMSCSRKKEKFMRRSLRESSAGHCCDALTRVYLFYSIIVINVFN